MTFDDLEPVKTEYVGSFVYNEDAGERSLKYLITPAGRLLHDSTGNWRWEYNLGDHLGNTRAVIFPDYANNVQVEQETHYYPFGLSMNLGYTPTNNPNQYLYNGKELQDDLDLGWYDYGARFYEPELATFHSIDRLAEGYRFQSPYVYAACNPVRYIDYNGEGPKESWIHLKKTFSGAITTGGQVGVNIAGLGAHLNLGSRDAIGYRDGSFVHFGNNKDVRRDGSFGFGIVSLEHSRVESRGTEDASVSLEIDGKVLSISQSSSFEQLEESTSISIGVKKTPLSINMEGETTTKQTKDLYGNIVEEKTSPKPSISLGAGGKAGKGSKSRGVNVKISFLVGIDGNINFFEFGKAAIELFKPSRDEEGEQK